MPSEMLSQVQPADPTVDPRLERAKALTVLLHKRCEPEGRTLRILTIMLMLASLVGVVSVDLVQAELVVHVVEEVDFLI